MKKFWALFFFFWPVVAFYACWIGPDRGWWFPGEAKTQMGVRIEGLFYLILGIVAVVFVLTQAALGYTIWMGATRDRAKKAMFTHGSHSLELIWTIVPAFVLVFIALYQMDVWADYRLHSFYPEETKRQGSAAELMARQFEWRIRYPAPGKPLTNEPAPDDLYWVNEIHVPTARPTKINLRTQDVQHAFFSPQLRLKQDAVPGLIIPVWFEIPEAGEYDIVCAELCGWGHYKMRARLVAESDESLSAYMEKLRHEQNEDGFRDDNASE